MRILQRNLKRTTDTFLFISHTFTNFVAISSLVLELLKKCRVRYRVGHTVLLKQCKQHHEWLVLISHLKNSKYMKQFLVIIMVTSHIFRRVYKIAKSDY